MLGFLASLSLVLAWCSPALPMGSLPEETRVVLTPGTVFKDCRNCPEMVVLPAGTYLMGAPSGEERRELVPSRYRGRAHPQHEIALSKPFAVGRTEVTRSQFARFVAATGRRMDGCWDLVNGLWIPLEDRDWRTPGFPQSDRDPVVCVSWWDAVAYTDWLSEQTQQTYRLLSETEWEFAARAGTETARYWAEEIGRGHANCGGCGSAYDNVRTAPVASFGENPFGLSDMLGNAAEWVADCWVDDYRGRPSDESPWIIEQCELRVMRGGSYRSATSVLRAANRSRDLPTLRATTIGFRIARDINP